MHALDDMFSRGASLHKGRVSLDKRLSVVVKEKQDVADDDAEDALCAQELEDAVVSATQVRQHMILCM